MVFAFPPNPVPYRQHDRAPSEPPGSSHKDMAASGHTFTQLALPLLPAGEYGVVEGQGAQATAPTMGLYVPGVHLVHPPSVAKPEGENDPAGHCVWMLITKPESVPALSDRNLSVMEPVADCRVLGTAVAAEEENDASNAAAADAPSYTVILSPAPRLRAVITSSVAVASLLMITTLQFMPLV